MSDFLLEDIPVAPLGYPENTQGELDRFSNILLIDSAVTDYQTIVGSVNSTTFPIVYSISSSKTELLALLKTNFTSIQRV